MADGWWLLEPKLNDFQENMQAVTAPRIKKLKEFTQWVNFSSTSKNAGVAIYNIFEIDQFS